MLRRNDFYNEVFLLPHNSVQVDFTITKFCGEENQNENDTRKFNINLIFFY